MYIAKKVCLACRHFSLQSKESGLCKLLRGQPPYPSQRVDATCPSWKDCGQQYFIRTGWIKRQIAMEKGEETHTTTGIIQ